MRADQRQIEPEPAEDAPEASRTCTAGAPDASARAVPRARRASRIATTPRTTATGTAIPGVDEAQVVAVVRDQDPDRDRRDGEEAESTETPAARFRGRGPLLLLVRAAIGGGRSRAADHAGDGDQRQHVRQRLEERRAGRRVDGQAVARARVEKPNRSAAPNAPNGRQLPKIIAASAMKPRPAVMFSLNVPPTKPTERYAPPSAASIPERTTAP